MLTHPHAMLVRSALALTLAGGIAALITATATPALAIYPVQTTTLTGPAINGVVPTGQAQVNQCHLPKQFGTLTVTVQSVNLPDGTDLTVNYSSLTSGQFDNLGSFKLSGGSGRFSARLTRMAGANDQIQITQGPAVILANPSRWAASYNC
jgi:hypothetical protein